MSLKSQVQNNRRQSISSLNNMNNCISLENDLKSQFVKLKPNSKNKTRKGYGHSQMTTNNFSRRNSAVTIDSTVSSTQTFNSTPTAKTTTNQCCNCLLHSPQSWSMSSSSLSSSSSRSVNDNDKISCNFNKNHKRNTNYEFTQQRCNYERVTQDQQLLHHHHQKQLLQRSWSPSEQVTRCNVSNSRIPTCSFDQKQTDLKTRKVCDAINIEFLALNEFRMENSKDCFSELNQRLLKSQEAVSHIKSEMKGLQQHPYDVMWWCNNFNDDNNDKLLKGNESVSSPLSLGSLTPMPYAIRQWKLREELAREFPHNKLKMMGINKSVALSHQKKY